MKHLAQIQIEFIKSSGLEKDIEKVEKEIEKVEDEKVVETKLSVFLGGTVENENEWRKKIKKDFDSKLLLLDPFEKTWEPEDNIYDEIAGLHLSDYIVFYKGGEFSKKEQDFLDTTEKTYKKFDNLDKLRKYLQLLIDMNEAQNEHNKLLKDIEKF